MAVSKSKVPDWFVLKKYDELNDLSTPAFHFQLHQRLQLQTWAESDSEITKDQIQTFLEKAPILELPLANTFDQQTTNADRYQRSLVKDLSPMRAMDLARRIKPWADEHPNDTVRELLARDEHKFPEVIEINLDARKSEVMDALKSWVDEHYEKREGLGDTLSTIRDKIIFYNSIPYIDLKLWASINKTKITDKKMSVLLDRDLEHIQDQTKTYAKTALSPSFINSFRIGH